MLKSDSLTRSIIGRVPRSGGPLSLAPLALPVITRTRYLTRRQTPEGSRQQSECPSSDIWLLTSGYSLSAQGISTAVSRPGELHVEPFTLVVSPGLYLQAQAS